MLVPGPDQECTFSALVCNTRAFNSLGYKKVILVDKLCCLVKIIQKDKNSTISGN